MIRAKQNSGSSDCLRPDVIRRNGKFFMLLRPVTDLSTGTKLIELCDQVFDGFFDCREEKVRDRAD